jgi:Uma2 family endonuclease
MAAPLLPQHYTPEEYLALERQAEYKSEYIDGQIVAMSGASRKHGLISGNIFRVLGNQILTRPCEAYAGDMRVKVRTHRKVSYTYPDVVVVCGEPQLEDRQLDTLLNPTLIVEVLSPSTEIYDRGTKFEYYRALPSVQEYLLVAQDRMLVEHFARIAAPDAGDRWVLTTFSDPTATLQLPSIGCALPLADVYHKVMLPDLDEADSDA